jgi:hypothetical protein
MRMSRTWRWIVPVALAGGLTAASGVMPAEAASTATYGVTISATSPHYPGAKHGKVYGYALVISNIGSDGWNAATISGNVTGAASGDVATLLAEPFGAKTYTLAGAHVTLSGSASESYAFTVKPKIATKYKVEVITGTTIQVTSGTQTVYITTLASIPRDHKKCTTRTCVFTYNAFVRVPASAYATEAHKRLWLYQDVWYGKAVGKYFYLSKSARASKARKVNSGEYEIAFKFYIPLHRAAASWTTNFCTKDTESRDGLGLPGRHGCGDRRVSSSAIYLG